jgi:hypothetical protein
MTETAMTDTPPPSEPQIQYGDQSLHTSFEQQIREMLDRAEITEEQKQEILVALQCPCCGSGGLSISV